MRWWPLTSHRPPTPPCCSVAQGQCWSPGGGLTDPAASILLPQCGAGKMLLAARSPGVLSPPTAAQAGVLPTKTWQHAGGPPLALPRERRVSKRLRMWPHLPAPSVPCWGQGTRQDGGNWSGRHTGWRRHGGDGTAPQQGEKEVFIPHFSPTVCVLLSSACAWVPESQGGTPRSHTSRNL